jgi:heme-degrading monooxygenase HmoA
VITEHAALHVEPGREADFEAAIAAALPVIESAPGCRGAEVRRQVEDRSAYLLLVRWDTVEAHLAFRETGLFATWRSLTHGYYDAPPVVTHLGEPLAR